MIGAFIAALGMQVVGTLFTGLPVVPLETRARAVQTNSVSAA